MEGAGPLPRHGPHSELAVAAQGPRARLERGEQPPGPRPASSQCPWPGQVLMLPLQVETGRRTMPRTGQRGGWRRLLQLSGPESEGPALPLTHSLGQVSDRQGCPVCTRRRGPGASGPGPALAGGAVARLMGRLEGKRDSPLDVSTPFISTRHRRLGSLRARG